MSVQQGIRPLVSDVLLPQVLQRIDALMGLRYQPHQWSDLLRLLRPAARELGFEEMDAFNAWLLQGPVDDRSMDVLAKHLTIGESYFFREIVTFSILRERVLPEMMDRKAASGDRHLRVWSAGCSTGEEVYSIAILLDGILDGMTGWDYSVLGTDINPVAVQRAREGRYRDWSFRDVPLEMHAAYFERTEDGKHEVAAAIREHTEFRVLNLVTAPALYPAGFDLVFCRNVLMYFTRDKVNAVVQGFRRALKEHGWLVPSLTETTLINNPGFEGVRFGDATLYRRQAHVARIFPIPNPESPASGGETAEGTHRSSGRRNPFASLFGRRNSSETSAVDTPLTGTPLTGTTSVPLRSADAPSEPAEPQDGPKETQDGPAERVDESGRGDTERSEARTHASPQTPEVPQIPEQSKSMPEVPNLVQEARRLADQGAIQQALQQAKAAVAVDRMDYRAQFMLATILRESGETTQALLAFERALYLERDFIPAHFSIGMLYHQTGHQSKSRKHLGIALALIEALQDMDTVIEPGEISAQRMADIIRTILER